MTGEGIGQSQGLQELYGSLMMKLIEEDEEIEIESHELGEKKCPGGLPASLAYFPADRPLNKTESHLTSAIISSCSGCRSTFVWLKKKERWMPEEEYKEMITGKREKGKEGQLT